MKVLNRNENFGELSRQDNKEIASGLLSLEKIVELQLHFNIPIYQRLYVWRFNQIRTLLEDIKNSYENSNSHEFYLGAVMLSNNLSNQIDLVDGQQRFTTLWLLCDLLSTENGSLKAFTYLANEEPRIYFSIRDKAQQFLKDKDSFQLIIRNGDVLKGAESEDSEIIPLIEGQISIKKIIDEFKKDKCFNVRCFADYVYSKIKLTYTFIPGTSDMNRVFEAMNNRGKQLEHHELLKSRLIERISKDERLTYALLWDACSNMNGYIEKSIKDIANISWKDIYSDHIVLPEETTEEMSKSELSCSNIIKILAKNSMQNDGKFSLKSILEDNFEEKGNNQETEIIENEYSSQSVRSIVSFPAFLLHTLRVYQLQNNCAKDEVVEVIDKKLLSAFDVDKKFDTAEKVKSFIELLWEVRVNFDKYVIKWIYNADEREEFHQIESVQISKSIVKNKNGTINEAISVQRLDATDEALRALAKIQGMLYHSQEMTTQYWLTPFLYFLITEDLNNKAILNRLEVLDNVLFYSTKNTSKLKERTFEVVAQNLRDQMETLVDTKNYLTKQQGTQYPNYIFYKLEYILWKNRSKLCEKHGLNIERWNNFKLTAKNSIEHIFPQTKKEENMHIEYISEEELTKMTYLNGDPLDDFGNLVLLSPGMNSEYSNMPYKQKKGKFDSKINIDSLKSELIFKHSEWNWGLAVQHRNEMIQIIDDYIKETIDTLSFPKDGDCRTDA